MMKCVIPVVMAGIIAVRLIRVDRHTFSVTHEALVHRSTVSSYLCLSLVTVRLDAVDRAREQSF